MSNLVQRSIAGVAALELFSFGFCWTPVAAADDQITHTLTPQALCELVWPDSEAAPDPQQVGFTCVRKKGMLWELGRAVPTLFSNVLRVEPGSVDELPVGSVRLDSKDPLSAWVIPGVCPDQKVCAETP
jgi:hypothetical protein